ncbi:MAG: MATE family efflux transporter [Zestosphaera sp.]
MAWTSAITIERYRNEIVNGPIVKTLLWLGFPLMIVQLVNVSYNVADAFWLSKYSDVAMAVPRQAWPPFTFFNAFNMALSTANMALLSQYIGARRYGGASDVASRFFTVTAITSLMFGITYFMLRYYLFTYVIRTPPEIFDEVMSYSGIIFMDLILSGFSITYSTILQSVGDTRTPAVVGGISALINIVWDPFLILGMPPFPMMGATGAAIATVLSRLVGVATLIYLTKRKFPDLRIAFTSNIDRYWISRNLRIGGPVYVFHASNSVAFMLQNALINSFGVIATAAAAIGFIVMDIADAVMWGLTMPTAIMIGQNLGAGNIGRSRKIAYRATLSVGLLTAAGAFAVFTVRRELIQVFTVDPLIFREAMLFLETFIFSLPFFTMFFVGMSVGRGSGHTTVPTVIGMVRLWGVRIGLGYLLSYVMGLQSYGIWLAMALSNIISGLGSVAWVKYGNWAKPVIR